MLKLAQYAVLVGAIVFALAFVGIAAWRSYQTEHHQTDNQPGTEKAHPETNSPSEESEKAIARYNFWLTIFTGVLAFVAIIQIGFLISADLIAGRSANAAKESADVARDTLIATNRPWVSVDIGIGSDLVYDTEGNARITINFLLKNVGKSPAANVQIIPKIAVIFGDSKSIQKEIAAAVRMKPPGLGNLGVTLFPGDTQLHAQSLPISRADIDAFNKKMAADYGEMSIGTAFLPTLVGCVDYKFTFTEGHHQTGFILDLRRRDPATPNAAFGFDIKDGNVAANRLSLIQGFIGVPPD